MGGTLINSVTTFNGKGLVKYGNRMLETYIQKWSTPLHVYHEGWDPAATPFGNDHLLHFHDLAASSDWLNAFKERHKRRRVLGFRDDAVRFSHKVAALLHACETLESEYIIWMDGDIVTHSVITVEDVLKLVPTGDELIAWLDRRRAYPECGFYILHRAHPQFQDLVRLMRVMYADDKLFELKEWHDSFVLEYVVRELLAAPTKSLSGEFGYHTSHPFVNGPLGKWMDHLKGKRKDYRRTPKRDVAARRQEEYWK